MLSEAGKGGVAGEHTLGGLLKAAPGVEAPGAWAWHPSAWARPLGLHGRALYPTVPPLSVVFPRHCPSQAHSPSWPQTSLQA